MMKSTVVDESLSSFKPMYCSREYQTSTRLIQQYEKSTLNKGYVGFCMFIIFYAKCCFMRLFGVEPNELYHLNSLDPWRPVVRLPAKTCTYNGFTGVLFIRLKMSQGLYHYHLSVACRRRVCGLCCRQCTLILDTWLITVT